MNFDAIVSKGRVAWLPNQSAGDVDALHVHDIPLIGTFEMGKDRVAFACLSGATSRINVWAYLPLSPEDAERLDDLDCDSTEELEVFIHGMFIGKRCALALARDHEIFEWTTDVVGEGGVMEAAVRFMDASLQSMSPSKAKAATQKRQAEQARLDATRQVLEPA